MHIKPASKQMTIDPLYMLLSPCVNCAVALVACDPVALTVFAATSGAISVFNIL